MMEVERAVCGNDNPFDVARGLGRGARDPTARRLYLTTLRPEKVRNLLPTEV